MTSVILEPTTTSAVVAPTVTRAHVEDTVTAAGIELVDIHSIYYWLHPAQFAAEHQEVGIDDKSDT